MGPYLLLLAAIASHVLPHPWWNFTAVGGALLYWGARRPAHTFPIPVLAMAAADWYLTQMIYGYPFHISAYLVTWAWYGLALLLGRALLRAPRPGWGRVAASAAISSTSFFLASNYAVWASPGTWYPHSGAGLMECYAAGLPFYRNDLLSTLCVAGAALAMPAWTRWIAAETPERA